LFIFHYSWSLVLNSWRRWRPRPQSGRNIFPYWDGSRRRWADPLVIQRDLDRHGKNWSQLFSVLGIPGGELFEKMPPEAQASAIAEANAAVVELASLVRTVFGVEPLSDATGWPHGMTDAECLNLLARYLSFLGELGEQARPSPSSPSPSPEPSAASFSLTA